MPILQRVFFVTGEMCFSFLVQNRHIIEQCLLWEPKSPMKKNDKLADIFSYVKFGQPGAILLEDGDVMMSHWYEEDGQYKTVATRIQL